jgi:hypothetical protein
MRSSPNANGINHINEQWQSYWAKLFEDLGYVPIDFLRKEVFADRRVEPWYRQNTLIYCEPAYRPARFPVATNIDLVLPEINSFRLGTAKQAAKDIVSNARIIGRAVRRRILRF